jgi:hypothetical protein
MNTERSPLWRLRLFLQRFWQPTSACLTCMPGSLVNVLSLPHWELALRTGLATGVLLLLFSCTRAAGMLRNRWSNAAIVASLTALGDAWSHPDHYGASHWEAVRTGVVSGLFTLAASFVLEDRARPVRRLWSRWRGL